MNNFPCAPRIVNRERNLEYFAVVIYQCAKSKLQLTSMGYHKLPVATGKFLVDDDKVDFELLIRGRIHDFYFAFTKGLQRGFVPHLEVHCFGANLGVYYVAL